METQQTGAQMDDTTKREIEQLKRRVEYLERVQALQEKYLERIGEEMNFGAGHFKKGGELVVELKTKLNEIK